MAVCAGVLLFTVTRMLAFLQFLTKAELALHRQSLEQTTVQNNERNFFSACLLTKDDSHFLKNG